MMSGMTSPEPLTPERRREMTRRHLLDAAAAEFAAKGFHGASLDAVAKAAGFTKGAVYSNFENKEALFLAVLDDRLTYELDAVTRGILDDESPPDEHFDRIQQTAAQLNRDDAWGVLFLEFVVYALRHPEVRERLAEFTRRHQADVEGMIVREREQHGLEPLEDVAFTAFMARALFVGANMFRMIDPEAVTPELDADLLGFFMDVSDAADPGA